MIVLEVDNSNRLPANKEGNRPLTFLPSNRLITI